MTTKLFEDSDFIDISQKEIPSLQSINHEKRQERKKQSAEDFTPSPLVNEILDRLSKDSNNTVWEEGKTFIDPAVGNGNFLIEVLKRKIKKGHDPLKAIQSIYGTDIMQDNIQECRLRLFKVLNEAKLVNKKNVIDIVKALGKNIVCTPLSKYPNGSLDYDFEFSHTITDIQAQKMIDKLKKEKLLDKVTI